MNSTPRLRAGIAMCVYNGVRYLQEQLDSIAAQDEAPVRMSIVDDGSSDGSWELLQHWAPSAPFEVLLFRNASNLGVVRNFEEAVHRLGDGIDIVFFADQDDIWYPQKLSAFVSRFASEPDLGLLHSDADLIDGAGLPLGRRLFDTLLVTDAERDDVAQGRAYRVYAKRNLVTGAACAVRHTVLQQALPFSADWIHDEWIAFMAALVSRVALVDTPLMAYRLHGSNTVGMPVPTLRWRLGTIVRAVLASAAPRQALRARRLSDLESTAARLGASQEVLDHLSMARTHAEFRADLPRNPVTRLRQVLRHRAAGHYHAWSNGEASILHDILLRN